MTKTRSAGHFADASLNYGQNAVSYINKLKRSGMDSKARK